MQIPCLMSGLLQSYLFKWMLHLSEIYSPPNRSAAVQRAGAGMHLRLRAQTRDVTIHCELVRN